MLTRAQRIDLVHNVVARLVCNFSDPENRGPNWELASLSRLIVSTIKDQAFVHGIPDRHHPQMIEDGLKFYERHLEPVMRRLVG